MKPFEILQVKVTTTKPMKRKKAVSALGHFTETNAAKPFNAIRETTIGQRGVDGAFATFTERGVYDAISGKFLYRYSVEPTPTSGIKLASQPNSYWDSDVGEDYVQALNARYAMFFFEQARFKFHPTDCIDLEKMAQEISRAATSVAFSRMADMEWSAEMVIDTTESYTSAVSHTLAEYRPDYDKGRRDTSQRLSLSAADVLDNIFLEVCNYTWQWQAHKAATKAGRHGLIKYMIAKTDYYKDLPLDKRAKKIEKFANKHARLWDFMNWEDPTKMKALRDELELLGVTVQGGEQ